MSAVADVPVPIQIALAQVTGARISGSAVTRVRTSGRRDGSQAVSPVWRRRIGVPCRCGRRQWDIRDAARSAGLVSVDDRNATVRPEDAGWRVRHHAARGAGPRRRRPVARPGRRRLDLGPHRRRGRLRPFPRPSACGSAHRRSRSAYAMSRPISARVAAGRVVSHDRPVGRLPVHRQRRPAPFVQATRVVTGGKESPATDGVEFVDGDHEIVVFVSPREPPKSTVDNALSTEALVERFKSEKVFWQQFLIAEQIVERRDTSVIPSLIGWLTHEDRHIRGNAAFIVGRLGDPRGFQVIAEILADRSDRPEGQGIPRGRRHGRYHAASQIGTDRYYAAHLLGDLRDPQAVPILVSLLKDPEVNYIVPWALGQIGDKRAIGPLINALDDDSPSMRVLAIYALETLNAKEAIPRLMALLDDPPDVEFRRTGVSRRCGQGRYREAAIARVRDARRETRCATSEARGSPPPCRPARPACRSRPTTIGMYFLRLVPGLLFDALADPRQRLDAVAGVEPRRVGEMLEPFALGQPGVVLERALRGVEQAVQLDLLRAIERLAAAPRCCASALCRSCRRPSPGARLADSTSVNSSGGASLISLRSLSSSVA